MMKKIILSLFMLGSFVGCGADQEIIEQVLDQVEVQGCGCGDVAQRHLAPCNKHEEVLNQDNSVFYQHVISTDATYATTYTAQPSMFAPNQVIVVTCMDYRIDLPALGLGGTYVLRNAGGRVTDDVLRSLIIAQKLLGVQEIYLIQHTDCGMQKFTNEVMVDLLERTIVTATMVKNCNVTLEPLQDNDVCKWKNTSKCCGKRACIDYDCIDWLTIDHGLFKSVHEDVKTIRHNPLIPSNIPIYGFIFDVITGLLIPVPKAMKAGRATPLFCAN